MSHEKRPSCSRGRENKPSCSLLGQYFRSQTPPDPGFLGTAKSASSGEQIQLTLNLPPFFMASQISQMHRLFVRPEPGHRPPSPRGNMPGTTLPCRGSRLWSVSAGTTGTPPAPVWAAVSSPLTSPGQILICPLQCLAECQTGGQGC